LERRNEEAGVAARRVELSGGTGKSVARFTAL
jgi:hypothetical protein